MKSIKQVVLVFLFCALIASCNIPLPTPAQIEMENPTPTESFSTLPSQTSTESLTPTFTPSPTSTVFTSTPTIQSSALLYRGTGGNTSFMLIGGIQNGDIISPDQAVGYISGEQIFDFYSIDRFVRKGFVKQPVFEQTCKKYFVETDIDPAEQKIIAVMENWPILKRPMEEIATNHPTYQQIVSDWLKNHGITNPQVEISQLLRVDLDGDGVNEVLISASHFVDLTGHMAQAGDYSIVLLRKVVGSEVAMIPVVDKYYYTAEPVMIFPNLYSLANVLDLNGDGNLEIIIAIQRWEGYGVMVVEVDGINVTQALNSLCGL